MTGFTMDYFKLIVHIVLSVIDSVLSVDIMLIADPSMLETALLIGAEQVYCIVSKLLSHY